MNYPRLKVPQVYRQTVDTFLGCSGLEKPAEGEMAWMENLSSDAFPLLAPRKPRGTWAKPGYAQGLIARDTLCYVDGGDFVMDGYRVDMQLTDGEKAMVSMGAYVVIFPDKKYINTVDLTDFGNLEAEFRSQGAVTLMPAGLDGEVLHPTFIQGEAPQEPENMALWLDTSQSPGALMQWSGSAGMWVSVAERFVKISCPHIGAAFGQYDGVKISGLPGELDGNTVIWNRGEDFLLIPGVLEEETEAEGITVERRLPEMDFVLECGNRLWGCRYGTDREGQIVNTIYASKLGDFKNWNCFLGLTTDSYAVNLGSDGAFTGAIAHMGYPLFFRENCIHKIYGNYPANFRLQTTPCRGVQRGSGKSLAMVGEVLYYKSSHGVCAYDGALPREISMNLGEKPYFGAAAGTLGRKYYISMCDAGGEYHLFVYDSARNLWHREDGTRVRQFCNCREELYFLDESGAIRTVTGSGEQEAPVRWQAVTAPLGADSPDSRYLTGLILKLWLAPKANLEVSIQYDSQPGWERAALLRGSGLHAFTVPIRVRRCSHLRLKLEGRGDARLYSLTRKLELGSDQG